MEINRKEFCVVVFGGGMAWLLSACGGGGDDGPAPSMPAPAPAPAAACGASGAAISGNHGHMLALPSADLNSTVDLTYSIQGTADHTHLVVLTAAQLAQLKAGGTVAVTSSTTNSHNHVVTNSCS